MGAGNRSHYEQSQIQEFRIKNYTNIKKKMLENSGVQVYAADYHREIKNTGIPVISY